MRQIDVEVRKTARYFQFGEISEQTKEVWFVLHGYGQLANYFLENFNSLNNGQTVVIAPEGLHRFYWKGFSGKVVASWMTREDRLSDVKDYINFLDGIYSNIQVEPNVRIRLFGFSQGTATACRWAVMGNAKFDDLIMWSGAFPKDIDYHKYGVVLNAMNVKIVVGNQDQHYSMEEIVEHKGWITEKGVDVELITFNGGHAIDTATLLTLI